MTATPEEFEDQLEKVAPIVLEDIEPYDEWDEQQDEVTE